MYEFWLFLVAGLVVSLYCLIGCCFDWFACLYLLVWIVVCFIVMFTYFVYWWVVVAGGCVLLVDIGWFLVLWRVYFV